MEGKKEGGREGKKEKEREEGREGGQEGRKVEKSLIEGMKDLYLVDPTFEVEFEFQHRFTTVDQSYFSLIIKDHHFTTFHSVWKRKLTEKYRINEIIYSLDQCIRNFPCNRVSHFIVVLYLLILGLWVFREVLILSNDLYVI